MIERFDVTDVRENRVHEAFRREHLRRYTLARSFLSSLNQSDLHIADTACGLGYGSTYLNDLGSYIGIDLSEEAVRIARERYPNANYQTGDLQDNNTLMKQAPLDAIVSFETIEHLPDPDSFLQHCHEALAEKNGYLIFSAPSVISRDYDPYHLHDRSASMWRTAVERANFRVLEDFEMGFQASFKDLLLCGHSTAEQNRAIARYIFTHPRYTIDRLWNWIVLRRFIWRSYFAICKVTS